MSNAIHDLGRNAHDEKVSSGFYVVGPSGQLVKAAPGSKVKAGWRLATQADIDAKAAASEAADKADVGTPAGHIKEQLAESAEKAAAKVAAKLAAKK